MTPLAVATTGALALKRVHTDAIEVMAAAPEERVAIAEGVGALVTVMSEKVTERRAKLFAIEAVKEIIEIEAKVRALVLSMTVAVAAEMVVKVLVIVVLLLMMAVVMRVKVEVLVEVLEEVIEVEVLSTAGAKTVVVVTQLVIAPTFVRIGQHLIGSGDLLELLLSIFGLILVRMILHRQLPERLLDVPHGGVPPDAQQ